MLVTLTTVYITKLRHYFYNIKPFPIHFDDDKKYLQIKEGGCSHLFFKNILFQNRKLLLFFVHYIFIGINVMIVFTY